MDAASRLLATALAGRIGVAREDITPPVGISVRSWGAAKHEVAEGIHRPLTVTAAAFVAAGEAPLLLLGLDFGTWRSPDDERHVRGAVIAACGVDETRVICALSHTHAGPNLFREDTGRPGTDLIVPYVDRVRSQAARAARAALDAAQPARLTWRYGRCDLARNRDRPAGEGRRLVVGFHAAASADDTLLVGRIETEAGGALGTIVNYACHPTTLAWQNRLISPDYPGAMRALVEAETGVPCLFLQGASGELAPAEQYTGDAGVADRHGRRLGHAVLATLAGWPELTLEPGETVDSGAPLGTTRGVAAPESSRLAAVSGTVTLALKPLPTLAELDQEWRTCPAGPARERLWRRRALRRRLGDGDRFEERMWAWRLGEALLVAQPNELYSLAQRELRRRFAGRPVAVLNLCNGSSSYLPERALYAFDQYAANITPFAPGSLEAWIDAADALARAVMDR